MKEKQSSITAMGIVVTRAVESEKAEGVRINYDLYAAKFLKPWFFHITRFFIDVGYAEWTSSGNLSITKTDPPSIIMSKISWVRIPGIR